MAKIPKKLYDLFKNNIIWLPFIIGFVLFTFEVGYEIVNAKRQSENKVDQYVAELKARMADEVEIAVSIIEQSVQNLGGSLSTEDLQTHAISLLSKFSTSDIGYIFVADYEGNNLLGPGSGKNVYHIEDKNGLKVVQELIKTAKAGGGYVEYVMPPLEGVEQDPKISFVLPYSEFGWYVGAGVLLDKIEIMKRDIQNKHIISLIIKTIFIFISVIIAVIIMSWYNKKVYQGIHTQVEMIKQFLITSQVQRTDINMSVFQILELRDIAEKTQELVDTRAQQAKELEHQAFSDMDTGYPNRYSFLQHVRYKLEGCTSNQEIHGAVVFVDIDNFKILNDTFGHKFGDVVIKAVGDRLHLHYPNGYVSRFGGDEYTLLIHPIQSVSDLHNKIDSVIDLFKHPFQLEGRSLLLSVSVGVATCPQEGSDAEDLLRKADLAVYSAKEKGKNRYEIFNNLLLEGNSNYYNIENQLKKGIQNDEFVVYYQPQFRAKTHEIVGFEALIRWNNPIQGFMMPNQFIHIAEKSGLMSSITQIVIKKASVFFQKINRHREIAYEVSVNVTPQDMLHTDFISWLDKSRSRNANDHQLTIELTETSLVNNFDDMIKKMQQLRDKNYNVALDDFGTGFSSLNYLVELPVQVLKIDRSFVSDITENNKQRKMVEVVLNIAENLDLSTVAEGIETKEQLLVIEEMGVHYIQGYYFSKPVPEVEALELIENNDRHHPFN